MEGAGAERGSTSERLGQEGRAGKPVSHCSGVGENGNPSAAGGTAASRPTSRRFRTWLLVLVAVNLLARVPLCWEPLTVRNDGAEYLAIARSLRSAGRYATDLKYQFYTDDPIRHEAWADRPPLYPCLAAAAALAAPALDPTAAARLANALLACAALVLAALYLRSRYGDAAALLTCGYVFLLPHAVYWTAQPMTESVSLLLGFGALLAWRGVERRPGPSGLAAGLLCGLHYLARPTGALVFLAIVGDALWRLRDASIRSGVWRSVGLAGAGFALCAAPYHLLLWRLYDAPFHSSLGYVLAIGTYYEVTYFGFEAQRLTPAEFLLRRGAEIPGLIGRQAWSHAQALLIPLFGLLPLAFRAHSAGGISFPRLHSLLLVLWIGVHTAIWSAWGSSRYFLLCFPLLAAPLFAAALRLRAAEPESSSLRRLAALLPAASFAGLAVALFVFYAEQLRPDHGVRALPALRAAAAALDDTRVVASDRPATLNLVLERPSVMLPRTTDPAQLARFIERYRPDALVLFLDEPQKRAAEAMAAAWRAGRLPARWVLAADGGMYLIARPRHAPAPPRPRPRTHAPSPST
jgi:hypothetical protein